MMRPIEGWSGDLPAFETWVRNLWPRSSGPESIYPQTIEFYLGQHNPIQARDARVVIQDLEQEDVIVRVRDGLARLLGGVDRDRLAATVSLRATRVDEEGKEISWPEAGSIIRTMTRTQSVQAPSPTVPPFQKPQVARIPDPEPEELEEEDEDEDEDLDEGGEGEEDGPEDEEFEADEPEEAKLPPPPPRRPKARDRLRFHAEPPEPRMVSHHRKNRKGSPRRQSAFDIVISALRAENAMLMGEHRFLIEQLTGSFERAFEIMGDALNRATGEGERNRQSSEKMQVTYLSAERERMKSEKDSKIAEMREKIESEKRVTKAHEDAKNEAIRLAERFAKASAARATTAPDPNASPGDRATERAVSMAEKVAERVLLGGFGGDDDKKEDKKKGGGGGLGDMAGMSAEDIIGMLTFLGPKARKQFIMKIAKDNPDLAKSFAGEMAQAMDETFGNTGWGEGEDDESEDGEVDDDDDAEEE